MLYRGLLQGPGSTSVELLNGFKCCWCWCWHAGIFIYAYCFYYYFARSDMSGLMQVGMQAYGGFSA
jgi:hypothetical protein